MKDFMLTSAGKATAGIFMSALLLAWPPALSWLVAAAGLVFAVQHLRESFRRADAETDADEAGEDTPASPPAAARAGGRDSHPFDVEAMMASLAAQTVQPSNQSG